MGFLTFGDNSLSQITLNMPAGAFASKVTLWTITYFLSRISLSETWRPATRKYCENHPWKMLKTSISILFSKPVLQKTAIKKMKMQATREFLVFK